jgi:hypothetical protein
MDETSPSRGSGRVEHREVRHTARSGPRLSTTGRCVARAIGAGRARARHVAERRAPGAARAGLRGWPAIRRLLARLSARAEASRANDELYGGSHPPSGWMRCLRARHWQPCVPLVALYSTAHALMTSASGFGAQLGTQGSARCVAMGTLAAGCRGHRKPRAVRLLPLC